MKNRLTLAIKLKLLTVSTFAISHFELGGIPNATLGQKSSSSPERGPFVNI